jgi:hypothetical protein
MTKIDLRAFLESAFGYIDAESDNGAQYPESRGMVNFFRGRLGNCLPSSRAIHEDYSMKPPASVFQQPWRESARLLADDLEELARQIRECLPKEIEG